MDKIITKIIFVFFILLILSGCNPKPFPVLTVPPAIAPPNEPEPYRPSIEGMIKGLPEDTLAKISVLLPPDREVLWGKKPNGSWEFGIKCDETLEYIVTAQAEGLLVEPAEYRIYCKDEIVFMLIDGQKTDQEANELNFEFKSP